jgi:hypothetical protein
LERTVQDIEVGVDAYPEPKAESIEGSWEPFAEVKEEGAEAELELRAEPEDERPSCSSEETRSVEDGMAMPERVARFWLSSCWRRRGLEKGRRVEPNGGDCWARNLSGGEDEKGYLREERTGGEDGGGRGWKEMGDSLSDEALERTGVRAHSPLSSWFPSCTLDGHEASWIIGMDRRRACEMRAEIVYARVWRQKSTWAKEGKGMNVDVEDYS